VHARTDPQSLGPTLRRIAADVSPLLRLHDILPLDHHVSGDARFWSTFAKVFVLGSAIVLFLSLAGIYSVTSFAVSRRTREIGVRVALGAPAARVIADIFRRPLLQVAIGVAAGCSLLGVAAFARSGSGVAMARQAALLLAYGIAVMGVCVLACIGPALRALRLDPVEALREDA
jgi:ABC-type antimicrobial peptide transport system permease subunit